jgi:hypothetical protein
VNDYPITLFCLITAANLGLMAYFIYRNSLFSAEGLAFGYVFASILSDAIGLLWLAAWEPGSLRLGMQEFEMRIYPGVIHLFGIISLGLGLQLVNPRPKPVRRNLVGALRNHLFLSGLLMAACGFGLFAIGVMLVGATNAASFYAVVDQFRTEDLSFGGFWYRGLDIALFGLVLMLVSAERFAAKAILILAILLTPLFLSSNKGGLEKSLLAIAFLLYVFNHESFLRLMKARILVPVLLIVVVAVGFKNGLLQSSRQESTVNTAENGLSLQSIAESGLASISNRYSNEGLYRGYCMMVTYMRDGLASYYDGKILAYSLNSWIPRILAPDKADHPFRGIGYMINADGHVYLREASAPTLVGYAYGDYGLGSTIAYLFVGGLLTSLYRKWSISRTALFPVVAYVFFSLLGGVSAEGGYVGAIYTLIMVLLCCIPVAIMDVLYMSPVLHPQVSAQARQWLPQESWKDIVDAPSIT